MNRKVIAGYWKDEEFTREIGVWMRAAVGAKESRQLRVLRLSDNMRNVAVTEGDKVEALIKLGWSVDHYGMGDIIREVEAVTDAEIDAQMAALHKLEDQYLDYLKTCANTVEHVEQIWDIAEELISQNEIINKRKA